MTEINALYEKIVKASDGKLKGFVFSENGGKYKNKINETEVLFIRIGKPLVLPRLIKKSPYVYVIYIDGERKIVKHLGIMSEHKILSPEDVYFRIFERAFKSEKLIKRDVLSLMRYWIGKAGESAPVGTYPFMEEFGSEGVNVSLRTPYAGGSPEVWSTKRFDEKYENKLCPAFYDERDSTGKHRMMKWEDDDYGRAYYNLPFPHHLALKRVNVIIKNMIKHYHIIDAEEPVVKARFNDVEGINLVSRVIQESDPEWLQYAVWDGGLVLTEKAAKRIKYEKKSEVLVFPPDEEHPIDKMKIIKPGKKVKRFDKVLKSVDLSAWKRITHVKKNIGQECFESYCHARIDGTFEIDEATKTAYINSGIRTVKPGDKLVSRTGVKGVVSKIVKKLPDGVDMVFGRGKIYSKSALIMEMNKAVELTGKPYIFVFLRDKIAADEYSIITGKDPLNIAQVLSDNFREAMLTDRGLLQYGQIFFERTNYETIEINEMLKPAYLKIFRPFSVPLIKERGIKIKIENGTGVKISNKEKEKIEMISWLNDQERKKITRLPQLDITRPEFLRNPVLVQQYLAMKKRHTIYKRYVERVVDMLSGGKNSIIRKFLNNPVARLVYRGILIPRKLGKEIIAIPPDVAKELDLKRDDIVMVDREPIISAKSVGLFRVKIDKDIGKGCLALDPQVMFSFSADCDGDSMFMFPLRRNHAVLHYSFITRKFQKLQKITRLGKGGFELLEKKSWNLVPMKKWLIEGTFGLNEAKAFSQYNNVLKNPNDFTEEHTVEKFHEKLNSSAEKQFWSVQMIGYLRKKVMARAQHLPPGALLPLAELFDVELGMDKAKLFSVGNASPHVGWLILNIIYQLMSGKKEYYIKNLTEEEKNSVGELFETKDTKKGLEIKVEYPKGISAETFGGVDIRNITPTPAGKYFLDVAMNKHARLEELKEVINSDDNSPYACMLRGDFSRLDKL